MHYQLELRNVARIRCGFSTAQPDENERPWFENDNGKQGLWKKPSVQNNLPLSTKKPYPIIQHKANSVLEEAHEFVSSSSVPSMWYSLTCPERWTRPASWKHWQECTTFYAHYGRPCGNGKYAHFTQLLRDVIMKKGETDIKPLTCFGTKWMEGKSTLLYGIYNQFIEQLGLSPWCKAKSKTAHASARKAK